MGQGNYRGTRQEDQKVSVAEKGKSKPETGGWTVGAG